jgi:hypothetical protein
LDVLSSWCLIELSEIPSLAFFSRNSGARFEVAVDRLETRLGASDSLEAVAFSLAEVSASWMSSSPESSSLLTRSMSVSEVIGPMGERKADPDCIFSSASDSASRNFSGLSGSLRLLWRWAVV